MVLYLSESLQLFGFVLYVLFQLLVTVCALESGAEVGIHHPQHHRHSLVEDVVTARGKGGQEDNGREGKGIEREGGREESRMGGAGRSGAEWVVETRETMKKAGLLSLDNDVGHGNYLTAVVNNLHGIEQYFS